MDGAIGAAKTYLHRDGQRRDGVHEPVRDHPRRPERRLAQTHHLYAFLDAVLLFGDDLDGNASRDDIKE